MSVFDKYHIKWCLIGGSLVVLVIGIVAATYWRRPAVNVLLVTLDTTRADHIGCYGYQPALTPTIDELSRRGVTFEQAYTTVPLTLPAHSSILTGLYPPENGIHINGRGPLPDQVTTLAEVLQNQGYATGAFVGAVVLYGKTGLKQGFQVYDDDMAGGERHGHESHLMRSGRLVVDAALKWLARQDRKPFFCWVHLYDPHAPFEGHAQEFGNRFADQPYDGDIAFADQQIGRLVKDLKQRGLYDQTMIVVVGDHGEGFGEHDEAEHGFLLYNATLRVPLVVAGPPAVKQGHRALSPVSVVDIFPSILEGVHLSGTQPNSGVSFEPALRGKPLPPRNCYSETEACYAAFGWAPQSSVTNDRWKLIQSVRPELYDLQQDPRELHDLANAEPKQLAELQTQLAEIRGRMAKSVQNDVPYDPKHQRQLQALGYISGSSQPAIEDSDQPLPDIKDRLRYYNAEIAARKLIGSAPQQAVEKLRAVTEAVPEFMPAWMSLGTVLQTLDRTDEAVEVYRAALKINPNASDAHFDLAKLLHSRGDREQSIAQYQEVLKIDPNYAMAHINLGSLLAEQGATDEASRHFEHGLEEFPDSVVGRFNFGVFLFRQQSYEAALEQLDRALALDSKNPQIRYQLGLVHLTVDNAAEAVIQFQETLRLAPGHRKAAEQLQRLQTTP